MKRRHTATIAANPQTTITTIAMTAIILIMSSIQANSSDVIDAAKQYKWSFIAYIASLVVVAFASLLFGLKGNRLQDEIRNEAAAHIAESNAEAKRAGESAALANERAEKLENDNLILRNDLNTESGKVAGLQKAASDALAAQQRVQTELAAQQGRTANLEIAAADAKAAQQRVEVELAKQQELTANAISAQKDLENQNLELTFKLKNEEETRRQLEDAIAPRTIDLNDMWGMSDRLRKFAGTVVRLVVVDDREARELAESIIMLLQRSGWTIVSTEVISEEQRRQRQVRDGIGIEITSPTRSNPLNPAANALARELQASRMDARSSFPIAADHLPPNTVQVVIGFRPAWYFDLRGWREERDKTRPQ